MIESLQTLGWIAAAIVLEAAPFLALGSLLSAVVEVYVSTERLARWVPRRGAGRIAAGLAAGFVLPTCECGVVPVVRRLVRKGVPGTTAVAYLIAAPIVNPVVLASTYVAFGGSSSMTFARAAIGVVVAGIVALSVRGAHASDLVREGRAGEHDHAHDTSRPLEVLRHAAADFLEMATFLVLGACVAAGFKTFADPGWLSAMGSELVPSVAGMMGLAVVLSVCSEADAFVAVSFVTFPAAAHLAFVSIGPMVDLKLIAMFVVVFRRALVVRLIVLPLVLVFALSLAFGALP